MMAASAADDQQSAKAGSASTTVQYIHLGNLPEDDEHGVSCYEATFEGGRVRISADGIDLVAARRALARARAEHARLHIVVGRPIGLAGDGTSMIAVGYAEPLFAYSTDDVELMVSLKAAKALPEPLPDTGVPPSVRIIA